MNIVEPINVVSEQLKHDASVHEWRVGWRRGENLNVLSLFRDAVDGPRLRGGFPVLRASVNERLTPALYR